MNNDSPSYKHQDYVDRVVAKAPPLNPDQRDKIASIFAQAKRMQNAPHVESADGFAALGEIEASVR